MVAWVPVTTAKADPCYAPLRLVVLFSHLLATSFFKTFTNGVFTDICWACINHRMRISEPTAISCIQCWRQRIDLCLSLEYCQRRPSVVPAAWVTLEPSFPPSKCNGEDTSSRHRKGAGETTRQSDSLRVTCQMAACQRTSYTASWALVPEAEDDHCCASRMS